MTSHEVHALLENSALVEIVTFELNAKRSDSSPNASKEVATTFEAHPNYTLNTLVSPDESGFLIRLAMSVSLPMGTIHCDLGAAFKHETTLGLELNPELLVEFANDYAVMLLFPYLRQHVADMSQRTFGAPLLMPVLTRGNLIFTTTS